MYPTSARYTHCARCRCDGYGVISSLLLASAIACLFVIIYSVLRDFFPTVGGIRGTLFVGEQHQGEVFFISEAIYSILPFQQ